MNIPVFWKLLGLFAALVGCFWEYSKAEHGNNYSEGLILPTSANCVVTVISKSRQKTVVSFLGIIDVQLRSWVEAKRDDTWQEVSVLLPDLAAA